jgi:NAD(P)-dependent dehydrogenase (short-subunit alcohol dehydrogenase family)
MEVRVAKSIQDQVVVITGASSGIGLATAREAARRGARVVMSARNAADLERWAEEIRSAGGQAIAQPADVADYTQVEALAARAVQEFGRIDTWINNAAVSAYAFFKDQPLEDIRRILEVNFMGQVHGARAALPHLEESGGALICVGSTLSDRGTALQTAYCASKHAVKGWLDGLRVELAHQRSPVRVTLVKPSSIDTPLFNKAKTQLGVMPRPIAPVYEPRLAVIAILYAAEHDVRDIFVGGAGNLLSIADRVSPRLVDWVQRRRDIRGQRSAWPKGEQPNNLFEALPDDGGVRGDFLKETKKRSAWQPLAMHRVGFTVGLAVALLAGAGIKRLRTGVGGY